MKPATIYFLLVFSVFAKILLAYFVPVFGDEAYYYIWSLHPQLSYFDHPPMVSWFISIGHFFLPAGSAISLRIVFILASFLISIIWIKILEFKNLGRTSIFNWLILFFLNPLLGPGSVLATPDVPLVLFWSLSYFSFLKLLDSKNLCWYALLGLFLGLGFCSKYHIVLFVISGLFYLVLTKKIFTLKPLGVFLTILFGATFSLPVLIWNAQNEWSSFLFQINHGFGENTFDWAWPAGYIIAQIILINPFILFKLIKKSTHNVDKVFSFSQLFFFFTSSFKNVVEGNWPLTSHLHSITNFTETAKKEIIKLSFFYWAIIYILILVFLQLPASQPVKKNLVNSAQLDELYALVDHYHPLYGPSYQVASLLSWKTQKNISKLNSLSRHDFYDSLPDSTPSASSFYVLKYNISDWPQNYEHFKKIKLQSFDNIGIALYQFSHD